MNVVALPSAQISVLQLPAAANGGSQEDVVMIHGLAANLGFWYAGAAQTITQFGRVTLFDLPGHGHSEMPLSGYAPRQMAELLGQLLDHLRLDQVHLVAHSFGGMVALAFALQYPERVKTLVLADVRLWQVEPPSWKTVPPAWLQRMRNAGLQLDDTRMDPSFQFLVELARLQLNKPDLAKRSVSAMLGCGGPFQGRRGARRWLDLIEKTRAYAEMTSGADFALDDLERIKQPILALFGQKSLLHRSAHALQARCPSCRLEVIPHVGHFFPLTRPRVFGSIACEFLAAKAGPKPGLARGPERWLSLPEHEDAVAHAALAAPVAT